MDQDLPSEWRQERVVKLGRKMVFGPLALNWAIQVGDTWYEIAAAASKEGSDTPQNDVIKTTGEVAASGAGLYGGEIVGLTMKSDVEIDKWNDIWLHRNPEYNVIRDNCQKYSFQFMVWLTDNNYRCEHRLNSAVVKTNQKRVFTWDGFATQEDGNAIISFGVARKSTSLGPVALNGTLGQFNVQAVAGPGLGVFGDASLARVEASLSGNLIGVHADLNSNTGIGLRNGNYEAHLLGFGFKFGADGFELNTPVGGFNACTIL